MFMSKRKLLTDEQLDDIWKEMLKPEAKKPIHLDCSAWEPCEYCKGAKFISGWASAETKTESGISFESRIEGDFLFCPMCGRPLTDDAWEMLEKRLEVAK